MAKINSKIDKALRKEIIDNGVFLGTVLIFGFNDNVYVYQNEVYVEQFKLTDDDYVVTDFYQGNWGMINTNIYNGKFNANEPYAEALIDYMSLYNHSLYLSNKKSREIAKEKFAELKKDYQESGLLDDINALLKKSKSKTFRYSTYESLKESNMRHIDRDFWIEKFESELNKQYERLEKTFSKNLAQMSEDDILGIINDCKGKSKTLVGKSEQIKDKFIKNWLKAMSDYENDYDRQLRIGHSEEEVDEMFIDTLENDIKNFVKLTYNDYAHSNYFLVRFVEENLI